MTMTLVSSIQVGAGGATSIEFTGIPQTGTDLVVMVSHRSSGSDNLKMTINSDTIAGRYSTRLLYGSGSSVSSASTTNSSGSGGYIAESVRSTWTASTFGNIAIYIPNYSAAVAKSYSVDSVAENNATEGWAVITAGSYTQTAAITSLTFNMGANTFAQYSTASLYTITKGSGGATVS